MWLFLAEMLIGALSWPLKLTYSTWMTSLVVMLAVLMIETPADQRWARFAAMLLLVKCIATDTVGVAYYVVKICCRIIILALILFMKLTCKCLRPMIGRRLHSSQDERSQLNSSGILTSEDSASDRGYLASASSAVNRMLSSTPREPLSSGGWSRQSTATSSSSGRNSKKLLKFDGSKDKDLDVYIGHFELIACVEEWTYEQKGHQLATSLIDRALEIYLDSDADLENPDYNHIVAVLRKHFKPAGQETVFLAEFAALTRKPDQTFPDFAFDLRKLAKQAYPRVNDAGREDIVKQRFVESLDEKTADFVSAGGPKNMSNMLSLAIQYEALQKKRKSKILVKSSVNAIEETKPVDAMDRLISMTEAMMQDF